MKKFLLIFLLNFIIGFSFASDIKSTCYWKNNNYWCASKMCTKNNKCKIEIIKSKPPIIKSTLKLQPDILLDIYMPKVESQTIKINSGVNNSGNASSGIIFTGAIFTGSTGSFVGLSDKLNQRLKDFNDSQANANPGSIPIYVPKVITGTEEIKPTVNFYTQQNTATINNANTNCSYASKTCYTGPKGGRYYINCNGDKVYDC